MLRISKHAVDRYIQRIRPGIGIKQARQEIASCISCATPKLMKKVETGRTVYVPLGCCVLICEAGIVSSVLKRTDAYDLPKGQGNDYPVSTKQPKNVSRQTCQCDHCGDQFDKLSDLLKHIKSTHLDAPTPHEIPHAREQDEDETA